MSSYLPTEIPTGEIYIAERRLVAFCYGGYRRFLERCVICPWKGATCARCRLNEPMKFVSPPKIQDFVFEIVTNKFNVSKTWRLRVATFGINVIGAEEKLNKVAIMFCIFIGKELACVHWAAATQEAINTLINRRCYKSDFLNNGVYLGWSPTDPKYRRLGLSTYVIFREVRFFATMGKTTGEMELSKKATFLRRKLQLS